MAGYLTTVALHIFWRLWQWKNWENPPVSDEVMSTKYLISWNKLYDTIFTEKTLENERGTLCHFCLRTSAVDLGHFNDRSFDCGRFGRIGNTFHYAIQCGVVAMLEASQIGVAGEFTCKDCTVFLSRCLLLLYMCNAVSPAFSGGARP